VPRRDPCANKALTHSSNYIATLIIQYLDDEIGSEAQESTHQHDYSEAYHPRESIAGCLTGTSLAMSIIYEFLNHGML
jgi:hypothetical protein